MKDLSNVSTKELITRVENGLVYGLPEFNELMKRAAFRGDTSDISSNDDIDPLYSVDDRQEC